MKVLFCIRNDYLKNFAGDSMQALKMKEYLIKHGISVEINNGQIHDYSPYDLVHLFNLTRMKETYIYYKVAKMCKKNIVISPIYWDLTKYYNYINDYKSIQIWKRLNSYRARILNDCKMVYPNSILEGELIKKQFGEHIPYTVVYNGIDLTKEYTYNFKEKYNLNEYILCVGRICERKNQLTLAKLCDKLNMQLVLIGTINNNKYFHECIKFKNVKYLGTMDIYNIYNAYKEAKLHALISYVETPGLVSLEAAASGCSIVSTQEGSAKEYFKDDAIYCDPYEYNSIVTSIEQGLKSNKNNKLKESIKTNYNWNTCIENLYNSYINMLKIN